MTINISPVFNFLMGRTTAFAIVFTVAGITLACFGKLNTEFVAFVTAIQGLIVCHSVKEDLMDLKNPSKDN